jgi:hypothetical protein
VATFKVIAFTENDFERLIYLASEKQVHQNDYGMKERVSLTSLTVGLVLDPKDYPPGTRFLLVREDR